MSGTSDRKFLIVPRLLAGLPLLGLGVMHFVNQGHMRDILIASDLPMVMITGQKPIKVSKQGQFQILNVVEMMRPLTKYTKQIVNVDLIPSIVREAFRQALEERPGAVHLELPEDIAREPVDKTTTPVFQIAHTRRPNADEKVVQKGFEMIRAAQYPLLLIGAGANRNRIRSALTRFITETGIFFFNTQMGKGVVDENHPQCLGTAALSDKDYIHSAIDRADLVINVGHDVVEKPPFFMEHGGKKVIHVNFKTAIVDNVYCPRNGSKTLVFRRIL